MKRPPGQHPTLEQAGTIVLDACKPEHPDATAADTVGGLFPLPAERAIFKKRIADAAKIDGFGLATGDIPANDDTTLGDVIGAVNTKAVS